MRPFFYGIQGEEHEAITSLYRSSLPEMQRSTLTAGCIRKPLTLISMDMVENSLSKERKYVVFSFGVCVRIRDSLY